MTLPRPYFMIAVLALMVGDSSAFAQAQPVPLAKYTFDDAANAPAPPRPPELLNTTRQNGSLALSGVYEWQPIFGSNRAAHTGYRAVFAAPGLDFKRFTVAVHMKPEDISPPHDTLIVGGTALRWIAINTSPKGDLSLRLNNGKTVLPIKNAKIVPGAWLVLALSFDATAHTARVYVDGKKVDDIQLPGGFKLETRYRNLDDRVWTFTNYSNSGTFKGLIGELDVFGSVLTDAEVSSLQLGPAEK